MPIAANTQRVIFTCKRQACKHVWAYEYPDRDGDSLYRLVEGERRWKQQDYVCPACGNDFCVKANVVVGTYNEQHICNARCMGATSGACDCSCGGANHGSSHVG